MIKNLVFDFGKVLVDYSFDMIVDTFFDDPEELKAFKSVILSPEFIDKCDKEDIPFKDIVREAQATYPQWKSQLQLFYDNYLNFVIGDVPGMRDLLHRYRRMGYKLYGLSNWCSVVHDVIRKFEILQILDGYVVSSDVHLIKPDAAIYRCLCERFNLRPEQCVFADDKQPNVEGARAVGMKAIHFKNAEQYENELKAILAER